MARSQGSPWFAAALLANGFVDEAGKEYLRCSPRLRRNGLARCASRTDRVETYCKRCKDYGLRPDPGFVARLIRKKASFTDSYELKVALEDARAARIRLPESLSLSVAALLIKRGDLRDALSVLTQCGRPIAAGKHLLERLVDVLIRRGEMTMAGSAMRALGRRLSRKQLLSGGSAVLNNIRREGLKGELTPFDAGFDIDQARLWFRGVDRKRFLRRLVRLGERFLKAGQYQLGQVCYHNSGVAIPAELLIECGLACPDSGDALDCFEAAGAAPPFEIRKKKLEHLHDESSKKDLINTFSYVFTHLSSARQRSEGGKFLADRAYFSALRKLYGGYSRIPKSLLKRCLSELLALAATERDPCYDLQMASRIKQWL